jgi:parvulin-like peptidyl-prolyl isomerase
MLKVLREKSKIFLWIVAVAFIGFMVAVWGMDLRSSESMVAANVVGKVNGEAIDARAYDAAVRGMINSYREQNQDRDPTEDQQREYAEQAWTNLIQRTILRQEAKRRGIKVTDAEVVAYIRHNPLEQFLQNPALHTDGRFDMQKYQQFLNDPRYDLSGLEDYIRAFLPIEKLRQEVAATVAVTESEIREEFLADAEKVKVTYLTVPVRAFRDTTIAPTEQEIEAYYTQHADEMRRPDQAVLSYVHFEKKPSEADDQEAKTRAEEVFAEAKGGSDFADLAQFSSEDAGTAPKGGDLGFFARGQMVSEFDSAAFSTEPGQIVGPIRTRFGYHVIKVEEKRKGEKGVDEVRARHILFKIEPSSETITAIHDAAEACAAKAAKEGFAAAVAAEGLTPTTTTAFVKGDFIPGIGLFRRANSFAFSHEKGESSPVFEGPGGYYVVTVDQRIPAGVPPLSEIHDSVRQQIFSSRARDGARARAEQILAAVRAGKSFEQAATDLGAEKHETQAVTRHTTIAGIGRDTAFIHAAFALAPGEVGGVVEASTGFHVLRVEQKEPADETLFGTRRDQIREAIFQEKLGARFTEFVDALVESAEIVDDRGRQAPA